MHILSSYAPFGIRVLNTSADPDEDATIAALRADPAVDYVIHDRILSAHNLILRPILPATIGVTVGASTPYDTYYTSSPQQWAVLQSGGFGAGVPGGPAHGPWDTTMGAGVRIAILDSGVDRYHPDIAPNLVLNLSEIDQSPSPACPAPATTALHRTSRATAHGSPRWPQPPSAPAPASSSA